MKDFLLKLNDNFSLFLIFYSCASKQTIGRGETKAIKCSSYVSGRYVTIQLPGKTDFLELCEVQVFGNPGMSGIASAS